MAGETLLGRYAETALTSACQNIRHAPAGVRNVTLNIEAFGMGQLAGAGLFTQDQVQRALLEAAIAAEMDYSEAEATIVSGLRAGYAQPRTIPGHFIDPRNMRVPRTSTHLIDTPAAKKVAYAKAIYDESNPMSGTFAEAYLIQTRNITGPLPANFRCHPGIFHKRIGRSVPALVAPVVDSGSSKSRVSAVHITYIDPLTLNKINAPDAKKMLGTCKGGAVWLGQYANTMILAEGIEKALFCSHASGIPGVAGLSSTLMQFIVWPTGVQKVIVCADPNVAGETGCRRLVEALAKQKIEAWVCYPPEPNKDWDECLVEDVQESIANAKELHAYKVEDKKTVSIDRFSEIVQNAKLDLPAFEYNEKGLICKNEYNALIAFMAMGLDFTYNEFRMEYQVKGLQDHDYLNDNAIDEIYLGIEREFGLKIPWPDVRRICRACCRRKPYHPVRDYLDSLRWDNVPRIDGWLTEFGGAKDSEFTRAVGKIMLVAAVRRIREPGCKFDEMVVFEGREGKNKSTALRILAGEENFSDDVPIHADPRAAIEKMRGNWIMECAELKGIRRTEIEALKAFLSRTTDIATLKYEAETTRADRQCIIVGTTNETGYLLSTSGNRRIWPIWIEGFDLDALRVCRDQLWAEAAYLEMNGASIRLPKELWGTAGIEQEQREEEDSWDETVSEWLAARIAELRHVQLPCRVTLGDVAVKALNMPIDRVNSTSEKRIARAMRRAGWMPTGKSGAKRFWERAPGVWDVKRGEAKTIEHVFRAAEEDGDF